MRGWLVHTDENMCRNSQYPATTRNISCNTPRYIPQHPVSQESTNYHFDVAPGALRGALDRFAQFFLSPLCLEGSLEREVSRHREMDAVDS